MADFRIVPHFHTVARFMDDFEEWVGLSISYRNEKGQLFHMNNAGTTQIDRQESGSYTVQPPTVMMTKEAAQQMMDQLWMLGLRPVQSKATTGMLEAKEANLNDLRKLMAQLFELVQKER